jgi:hypothetical protein
MLDHQIQNNAVFYGSAIALLLSVVSAVVVGDGVSKRTRHNGCRLIFRLLPPSPVRARRRAFHCRARMKYAASSHQAESSSVDCPRDFRIHLQASRRQAAKLNCLIAAAQSPRPLAAGHR